MGQTQHPLAQSHNLSEPTQQPKLKTSQKTLKSYLKNSTSEETLEGLLPYFLLTKSKEGTPTKRQNSKVWFRLVRTPWCMCTCHQETRAWKSSTPSFIMSQKSELTTSITTKWWGSLAILLGPQNHRVCWYKQSTGNGENKNTPQPIHQASYSTLRTQKISSGCMPYRIRM